MHSKKIKIAFFADVLKENVDGVTYTLYNIIKRVPENKFEFLFITPYPPTDIKNFPFPVYICRYVRFPLYQEYPFAIPNFDKNLVKRLDSFKPDIIHYTTPSLLGRFAVKYAISNNIPLTSTYHTHFMAYIDYYFKSVPGLCAFLKMVARKIMLWFYNKTEKIFVPTTPIIEELIETGIDKQRLMIWGRGIETDIFTPSRNDSSYIDRLCGKNTKRILFVSRLVWEKEIKTLIGIYESLSRKRSDIKFIVTGDGPQKEIMKKKMPDAVFTDGLHNGDLSRIYASSDLFVFPSITETFGNVVLEALASGLPVVAAAQGGPKGIIQDGRTGYLAIPKNVEDFCSKILRILDDPVHRDVLARNSVEYAKSQTWDALCELLFKTYENVALMHKPVRTESAVLEMQCI